MKTKTCWMPWLALCLAFPAMATSVAPKPLAEMVAEADHVVLATIEAVDMVDGRGRAVADPSARTGPGLDSRMRLRLRIDEVLSSTQDDALPDTVIVPLWSMWHYELGGMQAQLTGGTGIFLLQGKTFEPVYPAGFQRDVSERPRIERMLAKRPR